MQSLLKEIRRKYQSTSKAQEASSTSFLHWSTKTSIKSILNFPLFVIEDNPNLVAFKDRRPIKTWQELINIFTVFCVPTQKQREKPPKNIHRRKSKITNFRYDRGTKVLDYSNVWHVTQEWMQLSIVFLRFRRIIYEAN
jgi:hypothetical protein